MSTPADPSTRGSAEIHTPRSTVDAQWRDASEHSDDPRSIERSIDRTRDRLEHTLDALQDKLSPGQMLDRWLDYLKRNGGELASNFGERVKQNPLPLLLTSVGVAWLMTTSSRRPPTSARDAHSADLGERARELGEQASARASEFGARVGAIGDRASELGERASERIGQFGQSVGEAAGRMRDAAASAGHRMSAAAQTAREQTRQLSDGASRMMQEQPLLVGILAMAAGALLGAALPPTDAEDRWMGDTRDQSVRRAKETAADAYTSARAAAQESIQEPPSVSEQPSPMRTH